MLCVSARRCVGGSNAILGLVVVGSDVTRESLGNGGVGVVCECQNGRSWFLEQPLVE